MFKDVLNYSAHLTQYANAGLIVFFVVFVLVVLRVLVTPKRDIAKWSGLPLSGDANKIEQEHQS